MNVEIRTVKLSTIKLNPSNPRRIGTKQMDYLVKSLQEFPDMMKLREIVVDETMTVLGGNMRTLALRKMGVKEATAKVVTGLTPEQKREFIVKDNGSFGTFDMDLLSSSWDDLPLVEWGVDIPEHWNKQDGTEQPGLSDIGFSEGKKLTGKFTFNEDSQLLVESAMKKLEGDIDGFRFYI